MYIFGSDLFNFIIPLTHLYTPQGSLGLSKPTTDLEHGQISINNKNDVT